MTLQKGFLKLAGLDIFPEDFDFSEPLRMDLLLLGLSQRIERLTTVLERFEATYPKVEKSQKKPK